MHLHQHPGRLRGRRRRTTSTGRPLPAPGPAAWRRWTPKPISALTPDDPMEHTGHGPLRRFLPPLRRGNCGGAQRLSRPGAARSLPRRNHPPTRSAGCRPAAGAHVRGGDRRGEPLATPRRSVRPRPPSPHPRQRTADDARRCASRIATNPSPMAGTWGRYQAAQSFVRAASIPTCCAGCAAATGSSGLLDLHRHARRRKHEDRLGRSSRQRSAGLALRAHRPRQRPSSPNREPVLKARVRKGCSSATRCSHIASRVRCAAAAPSSCCSAARLTPFKTAMRERRQPPRTFAITAGSTSPATTPGRLPAGRQPHPGDRSGSKISVRPASVACVARPRPAQNIDSRSHGRAAPPSAPHRSRR